MTDQKCIIKFRYNDECQDSEKTQSNQGPDRIMKIIDASNQYGDGLKWAWPWSRQVAHYIFLISLRCLWNGLS